MAFKKLTDILDALKKRHPEFSARMQESEAVSRWEEAVGPLIAKHAQAVCVKKKVLWVEVGHPIWRTELHHRKQQILNRINMQDSTNPGSERVIDDIFFIDFKMQSKDKV